MNGNKEGSTLIAQLIHTRLFDLAEDAIVGDVEDAGVASARFTISTPEDGKYVVWVSPSYPVLLREEGKNVSRT